MRLGAILCLAACGLSQDAAPRHGTVSGFAVMAAPPLPVVRVYRMGPQTGERGPLIATTDPDPKDPAAEIQAAHPQLVNPNRRNK
jgi:hypothetical protein